MEFLQKSMKCSKKKRKNLVAELVIALGYNLTQYIFIKSEF